MSEVEASTTEGGMLSMDDFPNYSYPPLPSSTSIRLFSLFPDRGDSEILIGRLETYELDQCPDYEAVSYVWGDASDRHNIFVLDESSPTNVACIPITKNLMLALIMFRHEVSPRLLWADAICIDQSDSAKVERAQQVLSMTRIYNQASRVLVWLDYWTDDDKAEKVMSCMRMLHSLDIRMRKEGSANWERGKAVENPGETGREYSKPKADDCHARLGIPLLDGPEFSAFRSLLDNMYFVRAWTYQESFVARVKFYHLNQESWDDQWFRVVVRALMNLWHMTLDMRYFPEGKARIFLSKVLPMLLGQTFWASSSSAERASSQTDLLTLLCQRRGAGCKLSSDLVYSVIGAAIDCPPITVDYSLSFERVFTDCTWQIIRQRKDLTILACVERGRQGPSLPSWVPDWRQQDQETTGFSFQSKPAQRYAATRSLELELKSALSDDGTILQVEGFRLDIVIDAHNPRDVDKATAHVVRSEAGEQLYTVTNENASVAYLRTLCLDKAIFTYGDENGRLGFDGGKELMTKVLQKSPFKDRGWHETWAQIYNRSDRRLFIHTEKGLFGLADDSVQVGDVVVLVCGGNVPLVLRPLQDSEHYTLVSEAYIHGAMDGECSLDIPPSTEGPSSETTEPSSSSTATTTFHIH